MPRRYIDLSVALTAGIKSDPPHAPPEIEYLDHKQTALGMAEYMGVSVDDLPNQEYAAIERVKISTHNGTHVDAPYHYFSRQDEQLTPGGRPSQKIDELPLEWFHNQGVKLDFRHFEDGYIVQPEDVEAELKRIGHILSPMEIVLINTRAGSRYGHDDYVDSGCGMSKAATLWILEQGIRVVGTDGWSWDPPFSFTKKRIEAGGSADLIWEGHRAGRAIGYSHIEKLHNLEVLPAIGFEVVCFPVKIHQASAGWTRAVAIIDD